MKEEKPQLIRAVGLAGAIMMGLGSILGTGVFVSLGLAAGITGPAMIFALFVGAGLALCNGLSTAQLAADQPLSGGTYEYAYKYLHPWLGFLAGWLFVCAKSASAATAAIGFGAYFIRSFGIDRFAAWQVGSLSVIFVLAITLLGIRRSSLTNISIVSVTLISLLAYIVLLSPQIDSQNFSPCFARVDNVSSAGWPSFLEAAALIFVAYTGYGRIATLGEEVLDPRKNIPKAICITLSISLLLYLGVSLVSIGSVGALAYYKATAESAAPLEIIASLNSQAILAKLLSVGAMTAMLGVLLNLVLGLSRVVYAMGRKGDLPSNFSRLSRLNRAPFVGILASGAVILFLMLLKDIKMIWSLSALTVLLYYAITNIAALRLTKESRLYPRFFSYLGLMGCLGLGIWVEMQALLMAFVLLSAGVLWRLVWRKQVFAER